MAATFLPRGDRNSPRVRNLSLPAIAIGLFVALLLARWLAGQAIDYAWWSELGQLETWVNLLIYQSGPSAVAWMLYFALFYAAFRLGVRHSSLPPRPIHLLAGGVILVVALFCTSATIDDWSVARFLGSLHLPAARGEYVDPVFNKPLRFYFFDLPVLRVAGRVLLTGTLVTVIVYWLSAQGTSLAQLLPDLRPGAVSFDFQRLTPAEVLRSRFVRVVVTAALLAVSFHYYLARFDLLLDDHGSYLAGIDWVQDHVVLPLQWTLVLGAIAAAALFAIGRARVALLLLVLLPIRWFLPALVAAVYVRPNELALERPYIHDHIEATRSAFGFGQHVRETNLNSVAEIPLDRTRHRDTLDNVRLWDWRAFHDTVSQIQPLRPYIYADTDVDRYEIDGQLRQVLVSPRELEIRQLGEARNRWINPHLIYTHGYGLVLAEANRITADGLPVLFIQDAPPVVNTKSLRFTRPEIYYSEVAHEPVFVDTRQGEFNYPIGAQDKPAETVYSGKGGFPLNALNRLCAAIRYGDPNILITGYLTGSSRAMIRRAVQERLSTLAGFVTWDQDPYLVVRTNGTLAWIVDGYLTSDAHPYSRLAEIGGGGSVNYIRNSVKATIDAYTGETKLYIFDSSDILIQAYRNLLPELLLPASAMPADLRQHTRYAETLFSVQAEIYRSYHMRDPESFYNRSDLWDLARTGTRNTENGSGYVQPTYVVASLPKEPRAEFMLTTAFTPANKNNLIGFMAARCDGEHLGELVFEQLAKSNIVYGPFQIDARINQDQQISKDLTLWGQQGSNVLRGQTLVLPVDNSFLFVSPLYIQASQASMPQLRKVALAMGNLLAYEDTYEQALAQLIRASNGAGAGAPRSSTSNSSEQTGAEPAAVPSAGRTLAVPGSDRTLGEVREHMNRYRQLTSQGKWAEAGRELEEMQRLLGQ